MFFLLFVFFEVAKAKLVKFHVNTADIEVLVNTTVLKSMFLEATRVNEITSNDKMSKSKPFVVRNIDWSFNPYRYPCIDEAALEMVLSDYEDEYKQIPIANTCIPLSRQNSVMRGYWKNGMTRKITRLHMDQGENVIWCDYGRKIWFLFEPDSRTDLNLRDSMSSGYLSEADFLLHENQEKFQHLKMYSVILKEKDILYVPPKWPHTVYTMQNTFCISNWELRV